MLGDAADHFFRSSDGQRRVRAISVAIADDTLDVVGRHEAVDDAERLRLGGRRSRPVKSRSFVRAGPTRSTSRS